MLTPEIKSVLFDVATVCTIVLAVYVLIFARVHSKFNVSNDLVHFIALFVIPGLLIVLHFIVGAVIVTVYWNELAWTTHLANITPIMMCIAIYLELSFVSLTRNE